MFCKFWIVTELHYSTVNFKAFLLTMTYLDISRFLYSLMFTDIMSQMAEWDNIFDWAILHLMSFWRLRAIPELLCALTVERSAVRHLPEKAKVQRGSVNSKYVPLKREGEWRDGKGEGSRVRRWTPQQQKLSYAPVRQVYWYWYEWQISVVDPRICIWYNHE